MGSGGLAGTGETVLRLISVISAREAVAALASG
jgi:hypothetical protein